MNQDFAQRRRVAVALAITVIAVPAAFLLNRGDDTASSPAVTVIGTVIGTVAGSEEANTSPAESADESFEGPSATDSMGTTPVGFLDGTVPARDSDPATIAIPRLPQSLNGTGSFQRQLSDVAVCIAKDIPFNSRITVTNRDNSRSVQCINNIRATDEVADVVLHADAFLQIADLTDAPISVQMTW